ncbi:hypothetical protein SNEBB_011202 [Seison nebaliae]|nr:hypothetical protein SNEBB_011202 [Seison nebaliae]
MADFPYNTMENPIRTGMQGRDEPEGVHLTESEIEEINRLENEMNRLNQKEFPLIHNLIHKELCCRRTEPKNLFLNMKHLDVEHMVPIKLVVKVAVPAHEKINYVGRILGPGGHYLRNLCQETSCKMAVYGKGSMRDSAKERDAYESGNPMYSHLMDDTHVHIEAQARPDEAFKRISIALHELQPYILGVYEDNRRNLQQQMEGDGRTMPPDHMASSTSSNYANRPQFANSYTPTAQATGSTSVPPSNVNSNYSAHNPPARSNQRPGYYSRTDEGLDSNDAHMRSGGGGGGGVSGAGGGGGYPGPNDGRSNANDQFRYQHY